MQAFEKSAVLVVEDEPLVRLAAADTIADLGIVALEAEDAATALVVLQEHPEVEVLFTDVNMPGEIDGLELARKAHRVRPGLKVVVTSGQRHVPECELPDDGTFLPKPYRPENLLQVIRSLCGRCD